MGKPGPGGRIRGADVGYHRRRQAVRQPRPFGALNGIKSTDGKSNKRSSGKIRIFAPDACNSAQGPVEHFLKSFIVRSDDGQRFGRWRKEPSRRWRSFYNSTVWSSERYETMLDFWGGYGIFVVGAIAIVVLVGILIFLHRARRMTEQIEAQLPYRVAAKVFSRDPIGEPRLRSPGHGLGAAALAPAPSRRPRLRGRWFCVRARLVSGCAGRPAGCSPR